MATVKAVVTMLVDAPCVAHKTSRGIATVSGGMHHLANFGACAVVEAALTAAGVTDAAIADALALHTPGAARLSANDKALAAIDRIRSSKGARVAPVAAVAAEPVYRRNADGTFSPIA